MAFKSDGEMNRRGFLRSILGIAAAAALPQAALNALSRTAAIPDSEFERAILCDEEIINLMEQRMRLASLTFIKIMEESF